MLNSSFQDEGKKVKLTEKINPKNGSIRVDHIITVSKIRSDFHFYSVPRS